MHDDIDSIRRRHTGAMTGPSGELEFHKCAFDDIEALLDGMPDEDVDALKAEAEAETREAEQKCETVERERDALLDRVAELETQLEGWAEVAALVKARALLESTGA